MLIPLPDPTTTKPDLEGQRRPTTANEGQHKPTMANTGQRWPTMANGARDRHSNRGLGGSRRETSRAPGIIIHLIHTNTTTRPYHYETRPRRPTQAHDWPTTSNTGQHTPPTADAGQRQPTKANAEGLENAAGAYFHHPKRVYNCSYDVY